MSVLTTKGKAPARRMVGRPRRFTHEQIVQAAVAVMEREGFAALTMRSLGEQMGVSHSVLYNYVENIEVIEAEVVNTLLVRLKPPPLTSAADLRNALLDGGCEYLELLMKHPRLLTPPFGSPAWKSLVALVEQALVALAPYEPDPHALMVGHSAITGFITINAERARLLGKQDNTKVRDEFKRALAKHEGVRALRDHLDKAQPAFRDHLAVVVDRMFPRLAAAATGGTKARIKRN